MVKVYKLSEESLVASSIDYVKKCLEDEKFTDELRTQLSILEKKTGVYDEDKDRKREELLNTLDATLKEMKRHKEAYLYYGTPIATIFLTVCMLRKLAGEIKKNARFYLGLSACGTLSMVVFYHVLMSWLSRIPRLLPFTRMEQLKLTVIGPRWCTPECCELWSRPTRGVSKTPPTRHSPHCSSCCQKKK